MGAGRRANGLSAAQQERIEHAVAQCREKNGLDVSVEMRTDGRMIAPVPHSDVVTGLPAERDPPVEFGR